MSEGDHVILSWLPACGRCFYCSRGRQVLCDVAMEDMFRGTLPGGALRLSQNGDPLYHYSYLSAFAERCIVPEGCCVPIRHGRAARDCSARRLRGDDGVRRRRDPRRCASRVAP